MSLLYNLIFVDVSQFVADPVRTGVQRVLTQITRNLPRARIMPFKVLDAGRVGILDPLLFDLMVGFFENDTPTVRGRVAEAQAGEALRESNEEARVRLVGNRPLAVLPAARFFERAQAVLNLENFADPLRSRFYLDCPPDCRAKVYHLIHDFLLFENPGLFPQLEWRLAWNYVALFEAWSQAGGFFVATPDLARRVAHYFNRPAADVHVIGFGGDISGPSWTAERPQGRRRVMMLGTIEPRKFPEQAIAALDVVAEAAAGSVECLVVGGWGWVAPEVKRALAATFRRGRVRHLEGLTDAAVAQLMAGTDVAVSLSMAEGFGLPVIEFAALGIPVVTNDGVPSAALLPDRLRVSVERISVAAVAAAVTAALARGASPEHAYRRTWAQCAAEVLAVLDARVCAAGPKGGTVGGWDVTARLAKMFERQPRDWEELKVAVRGRLQHYLTDGTIEVTGTDGKRAPRLPPMLLEEVSSVVSDSRGLRYWTEIETARPYIVFMLHCILSDNYIECLRRAYRFFLGRAIDARAASEAPVYSPLSKSMGRLREIAFSPECEANLGAERWLAVTKTIADLGPVLEALVRERLDLFSVFHVLGLGEPTLAEVLEGAALMAEEVSPVEIALYFARKRPLSSDITGFFLDVLAEVFARRGVRVKASYTARDLVEADDGRAFIRRAYRLLLRKEVDDDGMAYYHTELTSGRLSREAVVQKLLGAPEARDRGISVN